MTIESTVQTEDLLRGFGILSTGGGGEPSEGFKAVASFMRRRKKLSWLDIADVPDDAWTVSAWGMGSIAPPTLQQDELRERLGLLGGKARYCIDRAIQELATYVGVWPDYFVAAELGGLNTVGPMIGALELGLRVIDGDYTGRAAPELSQTTPLTMGIPVTPLSSVDSWGNTSLLKDCTSTMMAERMGKYLSLASLSSTFMAGFMLKAGDVKKSLVRGTLTRSLRLGEAARKAREQKEDPIAAIVNAGHGFRLFDGEVVRKVWEDRDGYMIGRTSLSGKGAATAQAAEIWFKNENHILWLDGDPCVTTPDLICVLEASMGEPFTNTRLPEGAHVAVVGFSGSEIWRTREGLSLTGPKHFGFDIPYVPIEERMGR